MVFNPEAHTLLIVVHGVDGSNPAPRAAYLAGAYKNDNNEWFTYPKPAEHTLPIMSSSTWSVGTLIFARASLIAIAPNSGALILEREPINYPIGVLDAETIYAALMDEKLYKGCLSI